MVRWATPQGRCSAHHASALDRFRVHKTASYRDPETSTCLKNPDTEYAYKKSHEHEQLLPLPAAPEELVSRRKQVPMNGETAYADTAAAFAALPKEEPERLEKIRLIKYKQEGGDVLGRGYYCLLVRANPRCGVKSLYSPI